MFVLNKHTFFFTLAMYKSLSQEGDDFDEGTV